ncbi:MAG: GxxExxY protein [Proteobacteria bacterium]|nr:GxxExxY protein [Pseudomonadota bacterium]
MERADLTERVIAAAIAVHTELGPGFLEATYEAALVLEMATRGIPFVRQPSVPIFYRDQKVGRHRLDVLAFDQIVVELKAVDRVHPIHRLTVQAYLKATGNRIDLLLNFAAIPLGITRVTYRTPQ